MVETAALACPETFTIQVVEEFKELLDAPVSELKDIEIDASQVERIDTSGFQLLLAAKKKLEEANISFKVINPSERFTKIANALGVVDQL